jgi:hypothetical protein
VWHYAESHYAVCHAECHYAQCIAERDYAECHAEYNYAKYHYAVRHAECHFAYCYAGYNYAHVSWSHYYHCMHGFYMQSRGRVDPLDNYEHKVAHFFTLVICFIRLAKKGFQMDKKTFCWFSSEISEIRRHQGDQMIRKKLPIF